MNHDYQKIVETMQEIGIDESYIGKTLRQYGYDEFPKSGLDDTGLSKLVKTATEMSYSEASLTTRKSKKGYLPAPKIKKEKSKTSDLETSVMKEELKKVGKFMSYLIGIPFLTPTIIRKTSENIEDCSGLLAGEFILSFCLHGVVLGLCINNPKKMMAYLITGVLPNVASGIYEYYRHVKNKAKEKVEVKKTGWCGENYKNCIGCNERGDWDCPSDKEIIKFVEQHI
jgi:hypothetical protein